jgi:hypothetical protein
MPASCPTNRILRDAMIPKVHGEESKLRSSSLCAFLLCRSLHHRSLWSRQYLPCYQKPSAFLPKYETPSFTPMSINFSCYSCTFSYYNCRHAVVCLCLKSATIASGKLNPVVKGEVIAAHAMKAYRGKWECSSTNS